MRGSDGYTILHVCGECTQPITRLLWDMLERDGLVPSVFYEGDIRDAETFDAAMRSRAQLYVGYPGGGDWLPAAMSWLTDQAGRAVRIHFCFFRHGRRHALPLARLFLESLLAWPCRDGRPLYQTVYGMLPESNAPALSFGRRLGFQTLGVLPGGAWIEHAGRTEGLAVNYITAELLKEASHG
ncbi:hypothetical protein dsx2_2634 [Desulfovibrio sp. X2]|uniref:hypothetical protein n=1 Tax=Desulfovibrio sp. X2 TaxID=941449 RepID=UPI000358D11E|nr:hypothetical protein [Desulfovibrio sp. X2]EPR42717.1 hypothetical protein dsx2_2634 [Desulfovibrio sp. X2]